MNKRLYRRQSPAKKPTVAKAGHEWVMVPRSDLTPEGIESLAMEQVSNGLQIVNSIGGWTFEKGCAAVKEFHDYFPGRNKVVEDGNWIMVTDPPPTEYTVPPMSFWFAQPWPMPGLVGNQIHRVKLITPRGELGLFPREYSKIENIEKYYELMGQGIEPIFFGAGEGGIPSDALFYLRSRGISKRDAIVMLMGSIKSPDVMYLLTDKSITDHFGMKWPATERLATVVPVTETK